MLTKYYVDFTWCLFYVNYEFGYYTLLLNGGGHLKMLSSIVQCPPPLLFHFIFLNLLSKLDCIIWPKSFKMLRSAISHVVYYDHMTLLSVVEPWYCSTTLSQAASAAKLKNVR